MRPLGAGRFPLLDSTNIRARPREVNKKLASVATSCIGPQNLQGELPEFLLASFQGQTHPYSRMSAVPATQGWKFATASGWPWKRGWAQKCTFPISVRRVFSEARGMFVAGGKSLLPRSDFSFQPFNLAGTL